PRSEGQGIQYQPEGSGEGPGVRWGRRMVRGRVNEWKKQLLQKAEEIQNFDKHGIGESSYLGQMENAKKELCDKIDFWRNSTLIERRNLATQSEMTVPQMDEFYSELEGMIGKRPNEGQESQSLGPAEMSHERIQDAEMCREKRKEVARQIISTELEQAKDIQQQLKDGGKIEDSKVAAIRENLLDRVASWKEFAYKAQRELANQAGWSVYQIDKHYNNILNAISGKKEISVELATSLEERMRQAKEEGTQQARDDLAKDHLLIDPRLRSRGLIAKSLFFIHPEADGGLPDRDNSRFLRTKEGERISTALYVAFHEDLQKLNKKLDKVLEESFNRCEGEYTVENAITCINAIKDVAQRIGDNANPLDNIYVYKEKRGEIEGKIFDKVLEWSLDRCEGEYTAENVKTCINAIKDIIRHTRGNIGSWDNMGIDDQNMIGFTIISKMAEWRLNRCEGEYTVENAITCINDIEDVVRHVSDCCPLGDDDDHHTWSSISFKLGEIQGKILDGVLEESWKGDNTAISAETCIGAIKDVARHMGTKDNPWLNIEVYKRYEIQGKILDRVLEESWKEGKGKIFVERARMCREAVQDAAILMDPNIEEEAMRNVNKDLEEKKEAIKSNRERWQNGGLPGRGWPRKNYEDEQTILSASDRAFCASISETDTDLEKIQQLYWNYSARASLNIDASKLKDSTYERMHDYLSELEAAENEFRQGVKQMCLFQHSVEGRKRLEGKPSIPAGKQTAIMSALAKSWLDPAREKYQTALKATEEAYMRILAQRVLTRHILQRRRSDS
ncbi:MAG TPA: hypothetical protein VK553_09445, partial [Candidatus Nitrosopolaris rasttigaisensis]|nr:hypothetical protein [Candidatus Nitrosopolaris rasttigaisensis]